LRPIGVLAAVLALGPLAAVSTARATSAFPSLSEPTTPEQAVWGGPMAAGGLGPDALRANPSGLANASAFHLMASHRSWQFGLEQEWIGARAALGSTWLGFEVSALHAGSLEGFDEQGIATGSFHPLELSTGLGLARAVTPSLTLGASAHGLLLGASSPSVRGWTGNAGATLSIGRHALGLALRHLGPAIEGEQGSYRLPSEIAVGGLHPLPAGIEAAWTAVLDRDEEREVHGGLRWRPSRVLGLLAGGLWNSEEKAIDLRAGAEIDLAALRLAYGFVPDRELGTTHQLALALRIAPRWKGNAESPDSPTERRGEAVAPASPPAGGRAHGDSPPAPAKPAFPPAAAAPSIAGSAVVASPPAAADPTPATWSVWGGRHRTVESARVEARAWGAAGITPGEPVAQADGTYRVLLRRGLAQEEAQRIARGLGAHALPDAPEESGSATVAPPPSR
jgi:hypothetical protein